MPKTTSAKPKQKDSPEENKRIVCLNCGCKNQSEFYKSHNPFNKYMSYIPYCKDCIRSEMWRYFLRKFNNNEQLALHGLLRSLNLPYIHSVYLASVKNINNPNATISKDTEEDNEESVKTNNSVLVSAYFKNYNSLYERNGYGDTYLDSEGLNEIQGMAIYEDTIQIRRQKKEENIEDIDIEKYEVLEYDADELIFKWGAFPDEKLIRLEREYLDWSDKLGDYIYDKSTDLIVKQVCQQTVEIEDKRLLGEKVKDDVNTLQALLNSSGLIEKTRDKSAETTKIGMTIREIENRRPINQVPEGLQDVDKYQNLLRSFTGAISRTLGKDNQFVRDFENYFKDYTIDLISRYGSSQEEEDELKEDNI